MAIAAYIITMEHCMKNFFIREKTNGSNLLTYWSSKSAVNFLLLNFQKNVPYLFDQLDLNHDGVIDFNEALGVYKIFGCADENYRVSNHIKIML